MPRRKRKPGQLSRSDFDSWLKHPVTKYLTDWLKNESFLHRTFVGQGKARTNSDEPLESVGRRYDFHITLANEYEKLANGLHYTRLVPLDKQEALDEKDPSSTGEGSETGY
jgi:hypothetical protein